ncbi:hypothetical protein P6F26_03195 [Roseibacterium sp. SDUM158017]|uniref:hypothetical protein n=1 Tax=Roseicyclus salinarum TaxID=3036773 RepID=UPI0024156599|nr:hypothetical protein [Roseibacterium sp. SDUM158017]MDG4647439.1 hypothetical protein [Roseibacterium sp. SDUM158017]
MSGIGHNGGPTIEPGYGFRKVAWTKARRALMPALPLEVVRIHVARAKRLGLPYKTYATIRATSGRDIVAFLFSGNALALAPARPLPPPDRAERLIALEGASDRLAAVYAPLSPVMVLQACEGIDAASRAPDITTPWRETRARLRGLMRERRLPPDGVVLVSATALEREWCAAAGLAGNVGAEAFFARAE